MTQAERLAKLKALQNPINEVLNRVQVMKGDKGEKGDRGEDGYTPTKGVDYYTNNEIDSIVNYIQSNVSDGKEGPRGTQGIQGRNAETPIRGIDFWTKEDQAKMIGDVLKQIKIPTPKDGKNADVNEVVKLATEELGKNFNIKKILNDPQLRMLLHGSGSGSAAAVTKFTSLIDVPNSYTGQALKAVRVNTAATGLEFYTPTGGGITNLDYISLPTNGIVTSDTGTDATIPLANGTNAGLTLNDYTTTEKNKLGFVTVTQSVNLDTIESNSDASKVKTDFITITQPVNLDTLESDTVTNAALITGKQNTVTLTTTGTSGASTFNSTTGALNIPNYASSNASTLTWDFLVDNWSVKPTKTLIATGKVFTHTLLGTTRYRFVPTIYNPTQDAFYSNFDGTTLTNLITTRG